MNIAIIQENQKKFFGLEEQIRSRTRVVDKIYSCRYPSEFLELPHWAICELIIAENEISGRSDAGLQFFQEFFKAHKDKSIYGLLFTWGTGDFNALRIRVHWLHQQYPNFLGIIFEQIGDYEKILDVIHAVECREPFPIFDHPMTNDGKKDIEHKKRRLDLEKLINLNDRIQERLLFFVQLLRFHLERGNGADFRHTLNDFPEYRKNLPERFGALSQDVNELIKLIKSSRYLSDSSEMRAVHQDITALTQMIQNGQYHPPHLLNLKPVIDFCLTSPGTGTKNPLKNETPNSLQKFLNEYDDLTYMVSHLIETAHLVIKMTNLKYLQDDHDNGQAGNSYYRK